jgi:MFS family permease
LGFISKSIGISPKKLFTLTIINAGTLAWYFFFSYVSFEIVFQNLSKDIKWIHFGEVLFYSFAFFSAIIASSLSNKFNRKKLLWVWIFSGILSTALVAFVQGEFFIWIVGPLLGISLGLGFPYSLSLLADCTESEQRGRVSGILLLETFVMLAFATVVEMLINSWFIGIIIVLIILRVTSLFALFVDDCEPCCKFIDEKTSKKGTWLSILTYRRFVLYFVPWMLFMTAAVITEYVLWPPLKTDISLEIAFQFGGPLHYLGTAICGIISGIIADRVGRRTPSIIGLILLGTSFVFMSFIVNIYTVFANMMAVGMAFGFLLVVSIAVPGDLAFPKSKERFYALIIVLPLAVYGGLGAVTRVLGYTGPRDIILLILIIVMYLLIIPVWISEESLSSEKIRQRKIKEHLKKVKELVEGG